eukprot:6323571-Amphidinium_carterae.1
MWRPEIKNMNWCFSELNFYAQCNRFSLAFEKELRDYYDASIKNQCDNEKELTTLTELHRLLDGPYGLPCGLEQPNDVLIDWCKWAHAKSVNNGFLPEQSRQHLIDGLEDATVEHVTKNVPLEGRQRRIAPDAPTGVFPWNWPKPEVEESHDSYRDAINIALIMEDIDNQCEVPHEELYKYNPQHRTQTAMKQTQE